MIYESRIINIIMSLERIIIYGAGVMGHALKLCLESSPYNRDIECFLVRNLNDNPSKIGDTYVLALEDASIYKNETIIVALNEKNMLTAVEDLKDCGFNNLLLLDAASDDWACIKGNFFEANPSLTYLPFNPIEYLETMGLHQKELSIYTVNSIFDKTIHAAYSGNSFEIPLQVGAELTDKSICNLKDNIGENISHKNRQYCELTAWYWCWKNATSDYVGIEHYRRRFNLDNNCIRAIRSGQSDIVLTIPVINTNGIGRQYGKSHDEKDWVIVKELICQLSPEYEEAFTFVEQQIYFHAYNMVIMRRDIFDEYCKWLFLILHECERWIGEKSDSYQNRYPGFIAERLLNVFCYKNKDKYKIYIAKKYFLT